jgi:hypothetical protein
MQPPPFPSSSPRPAPRSLLKDYHKDDQLPARTRLCEMRAVATQLMPLLHEYSHMP